jgi:hypothetical protein
MYHYWMILLYAQTVHSCILYGSQKKNSDYFPGFNDRDGVCLLRGTTSV